MHSKTFWETIAKIQEFKFLQTFSSENSSTTSIYFLKISGRGREILFLSFNWIVQGVTEEENNGAARIETQTTKLGTVVISSLDKTEPENQTRWFQNNFSPSVCFQIVSFLML